MTSRNGTSEVLDRRCVPGVGRLRLRSCRAAGQGRQGGPPSARASAPVDLTGMWVSVVTEDWRWRMRTPPKGDYASLPLNDAAIKTADNWDQARDVAAGEQCRPFGGAAIMRVPGRIRISWNDDTTLKVETEAGTQTRSFAFGPVQAGEPSWQGVSAASLAGGRRRVDGGVAGLRKAARCASSRRAFVQGICAGTACHTAATPASPSTSIA